MITDLPTKRISSITVTKISQCFTYKMAAKNSGRRYETELRHCYSMNIHLLLTIDIEWCGAGMVVCLEPGADLHMAQLMPLPLTVSCFNKIQIGFTFLVLADPGSPGKRAVKRVCVTIDRDICWLHPLQKALSSGPASVHSSVCLFYR